jgi:resuscitation-promoting factor RpfB
MQEKDITLGKNDDTSAPMTKPITPGMKLEIWRDGKQTVTEEEAVKFKVRQIQDKDRKVGYKEVKTPGKNGKKVVTYEIVMKNGKEVKRKIVQSVVTEQPQEQVEIVGAKNNYSGSVNEWLAALRSCEAPGSGYTTNTGNGFYGAYQFMSGTWNRIAPMAGRPDLVGVRPDKASPADQDFMIIANTKLSSGGLASQNPGCYQKLGLSAFPPQ